MIVQKISARRNKKSTKPNELLPTVMSLSYLAPKNYTSHLNNLRSTTLKSSLAANIISILIFIMGFAMHLNKCTARTPIGTAAIIQTTLTAGTLDIVLLTHIVPCKCQCDNDVEEKRVGNHVIHYCSQSVSAIGSCVSIAK